MGGGVLLRIFCIVSRIPRVFSGKRGFVKDIMYSVADTKGGLRVGGFLRVYCIVSRITRVF